MAFTSRASRQTSFMKTSTPQEVGPGSYNSTVGSEQIRGRAPFSSTAERSLNTGQAVWVTPGPGSYQPKGAKNLHVPKAAATSNSFVNKVERFAPTGPQKEKESTPGPGNYDVSGDVRSRWIKDGSGHTAPRQGPASSMSIQGNAGQNSSVVWFKKPSPPSIPTHAQSYGYEQAADGQLTRQAAPARGHTGKAHDSAGPGSYNPNASSLGKRATGWALSKVQRKFIQENKVPGPGEYHKDQVPGQGDSAQASASASSAANESARGGEGTCQFKSKVSRGLGSSENPKGKSSSTLRTPGPGAYDSYSSFKTSQVPENLQFFGTTSRRSFEVEPSQYAASFQWKTPGPGAYEERRHTFKKKNGQGGRAALELQGKGGAAPKAGFDSRERRFKSASSFAPGPGAYDERNQQGSLVSAIEKKTHARNGVFGSSEPNRFFGSALHTAGATATVLPGPGTYDVADSGDGGAGSHATGRRRRPKQSSAFKSNTTRFSSSAPGGKSMPAPGDYDVVPKWAGQESERLTLLERDVFISAAQRFPNREVCPGQTNMLTPGPGQYNPKSAALNPSSVDPRHMGLAALEGRTTMPMSRRFASENPARDKLGVPGPGSYNATNPSHTFVRRSYNITIDL